MSEKRTVVITGCSAGGIGSVLALAFALQGYRVFATARNPAKAAQLNGLPDVEIVQLDVTSKDSIAAAAKEIQVKSGGGDDYKVDILINNAGFGTAGPLMEVDLDEVRKVFDTNVWGVLAVTQAFKGPLMRARGKVVNISSVGALYNTPWIGVYSASKAAVTLMSETLRLEVAPLGIDVITAMLGAVESNFHANDTGHTLSDDSAYKSIESYIAKAAGGEIGPAKQDVKTFVQNLIHDIERGATGQVWRGSFASVVRYTGYHLPAPIIDNMLLPGSGLREMETNPESSDRPDQTSNLPM